MHCICCRQSLCVPPHPSVTSSYCIKTTGQIELVLAWMLPSNCPMLRWKEIRISQKYEYSPLELCPKGTLDFRHCKSIVLSTKLVDGRACWQHLRRSPRRLTLTAYIVYYTSVHRNAVTLNVLWICCTTCSYSYAAVGKISLDIARRAVPSFLFLLTFLMFGSMR